ncbi:MAG: polymerase, sigma-24 subunit, subfamily [Chloroflexi bacterium]|jgi:RNA polymerase sigma factor (sigma-70 family)|nr:polymerase, sigma-24 subunit, subfamily [Chloroflexota bacterium]
MKPMYRQRLPELIQKRVPRAETLLGNVESIYGFIYSRVGNREAAEALTTRVFIDVTGRTGEDRTDDNVRTWLYAAARSAVATYWQSRVNQHGVSTLDLAGQQYFDMDPEKDVWSTRMLARGVLDGLPERERAVLHLRLVQGLTVEKTGETLGLEPGNVRIIQLQALRRAAELLGRSQAVPADHEISMNELTV